MMRLPKRIALCPIIDSVVELRFDSAIQPDAIFGIIFSAVKTEYPQFQRLPVADVPEPLRNHDPNLKFSPHYQGVSSSFVLRIGPRVVSLSNVGEYVGWDKFLLKLKDILDKLNKVEIVSKFTRIGIRYIDFFENDIFDNVTFTMPDIIVDKKPLPSKQRIYRSVVEYGKFLTNIQIANNSQATIQGAQKTGSVLDSDTFFESTAGFSFSGLFELIDECHSREKELFFSLLKQEFIDTLNPEY